MRADPTLPLIFTRNDALGAGMTRHQIAHRVRTCRWRALRRTVYIQERRYAVLTVREMHTAAVLATLMARPDTFVASHLSAAVVYGWALPLGGAGPVTVTDGDLDAPTRRWPDLTIQVASLPDADVRTHHVGAAGTRWEVRTTNRARTIADNLRHLPNADGRAKYFVDQRPPSVDVELAAEELLDHVRRRLMQEKERRDRIADLGVELERWGTREIVRSPREVLARIGAARRRGAAGRFRGRTAYLPAPAWLVPNRRRAG